MAGKIVIPLFDLFDVETYDGLLGFVERHMELDAETVSQLPTLLRMAEYKLDRMARVPARESVSIVSTTADVSFLPLPSDYRELKSVYLGNAPLAGVSLDAMQAGYGGLTGSPTTYSIVDDQIYVAPVPVEAATVTINYLKRLDPLTPSNQTNWLLANNADLYVYALLVQVCGFLHDLDAASVYKSLLEETLAEVMQQGSRFRHSQPLRARFKPREIGSVIV